MRFAWLRQNRACESNAHRVAAGTCMHTWRLLRRLLERDLLTARALGIEGGVVAVQGSRRWQSDVHCRRRHTCRRQHVGATQSAARCRLLLLRRRRHGVKRCHRGGVGVTCPAPHQRPASGAPARRHSSRAVLRTGPLLQVSLSRRPETACNAGVRRDYGKAGTRVRLCTLSLAWQGRDACAARVEARATRSWHSPPSLSQPS